MSFIPRPEAHSVEAYVKSIRGGRVLPRQDMNFDLQQVILGNKRVLPMFPHQCVLSSNWTKCITLSFNKRVSDRRFEDFYKKYNYLSEIKYLKTSKQVRRLIY